LHYPGLGLRSCVRFGYQTELNGFLAPCLVPVRPRLLHFDPQILHHEDECYSLGYRCVRIEGVCITTNGSTRLFGQLFGHGYVTAEPVTLVHIGKRWSPFGQLG